MIIAANHTALIDKEGSTTGFSIFDRCGYGFKLITDDDQVDLVPVVFEELKHDELLRD